MDDPRLARRLARASWAVLVTAFVVIGSLHLPPMTKHAAIALVIAAMLFMNAPTMLGLWRSRAHARTSAFHLVAVSLLVRALATGWVVWIL
jgi:hypothetical protein